jgi:hypothetical protein
MKHRSVNPYVDDVAVAGLSPVGELGAALLAREGLRLLAFASTPVGPRQACRRVREVDCLSQRKTLSCPQDHHRNRYGDRK